jgi:hypothetical protein
MTGLSPSLGSTLTTNLDHAVKTAIFLALLVSAFNTEQCSFYFVK